MSLWGRDKITLISKHPASSFLTFLLIGIFLLILFSSAPIRRELLFSASVFNQTWDGCLGVCAPLVATPKGLCCLLSGHLVHCSPSLYSRQFDSPLLTHPPVKSLYLCLPPPPSSDRFVLTATSCSPWLLAASVHACRKNVLPGAWIVLWKHVQHPV